MRLRHAPAVLLVLATVSSGDTAVTTDVERWVAARGALLTGPAQERAERVLRSVHPCVDVTPVRVHVLGSRHVGAFAWPQGDVVVTTGLLEVLDDDELAAALAHELGHLLSEGHLGSAATLIGRVSHDEAESAADEIGIRLLSAGGRHAEAMVRMLSKVQGAVGRDHATFPALERRVRRLRRNASVPERSR